MIIQNIMNNTSKNQKIIALICIQAIVILIIVICANVFLGEKQYATIQNNNETEKQIPDSVKDFVSDNIWRALVSYDANVKQNRVNDISVREGSLETEENSDGSIGASFIVDIDSLKQTFLIKTGWSGDGAVVYEVNVECPTRDLMKYPETVCVTPYNDSYSLDLYLPYEITDGDGEDAEVMAYIEGNEADGVIDVEMVPCWDTDEIQNEVDAYLDYTGIDLSQYDINYYVVTSDVDCDNISENNIEWEE